MNKVFAILLRCIGIGSVAGLVATIPMTLFMLLMQQLLPKWQKYALPPERITTELAKRAKVGKHMNKPQRVGATLIMHFGYGSNMGIFYTPIAQSTSSSCAQGSNLWFAGMGWKLLGHRIHPGTLRSCSKTAVAAEHADDRGTSGLGNNAGDHREYARVCHVRSARPYALQTRQTMCALSSMRRQLMEEGEYPGLLWFQALAHFLLFTIMVLSQKTLQRMIQVGIEYPGCT